MSKANPDGEGVACAQEECNNDLSSNWFGKKGNKICRSCYGKLNQRVGAPGQRFGAAGAYSGSTKRVALEAPAVESPIAESPLDAAASVKEIKKILGERFWDPSKAAEPADLREPLDDDEIELEYLVFGRFARLDRPNELGFYSTRWCTLDNLVEHLGMGQIDEKVSAWRAAASAHAREKLTELMEARAAVQEAAQAAGARESD